MPAGKERKGTRCIKTAHPHFSTLLRFNTPRQKKCGETKSAREPPKQIARESTTLLIRTHTNRTTKQQLSRSGIWRTFSYHASDLIGSLRQTPDQQNFGVSRFAPLRSGASKVHKKTARQVKHLTGTTCLSGVTNSAGSENKRISRNSMTRRSKGTMLDIICKSEAKSTDKVNILNRHRSHRKNCGRPKCQTSESRKTPAISPISTQAFQYTAITQAIHFNTARLIVDQILNKKAIFRRSGTQSAVFSASDCEFQFALNPDECKQIAIQSGWSQAAT